MVLERDELVEAMNDPRDDYPRQDYYPTQDYGRYNLRASPISYRTEECFAMAKVSGYQTQESDSDGRPNGVIWHYKGGRARLIPGSRVHIVRINSGLRSHEVLWDPFTSAIDLREVEAAMGLLDNDVEKRALAVLRILEATPTRLIPPGPVISRAFTFEP